MPVLAPRWCHRRTPPSRPQSNRSRLAVVCRTKGARSWVSPPSGGPSSGTAAQSLDVRGASAPSGSAACQVERATLALPMSLILQRADLGPETMSTQPLTDAEFDRLTEVLQRCGKHAMNIEMLDGFLAALICGPETVLPSEYLPKIWGDEPAFDSQSVVRESLLLIMRHWNAICHHGFGI